MTFSQKSRESKQDLVLVWACRATVEQGQVIPIHVASSNTSLSYRLVGWVVYDSEGKMVAENVLDKSKPVPFFDDWDSANSSTGVVFEVDTAAFRGGFYRVGVTVESSDHQDKSLIRRVLELNKKGSSTLHDEVAQCYFGVRSAIRTDRDVALLVPTFTLQAYNDLGDGNFYKPRPSIAPGVRSVNLFRPLANCREESRDYHTFAPAIAFERAVRMLGLEPVPIESMDVHMTPGAELIAYPQILITAHDEYLTREQREHLVDYVRFGGRLSIFCGNFCWWKIRVEEDHRISVCKVVADEIEDRSERRGIWANKRVGTDPSADFGLTFRHGGYPIERYLQEGEAEELGLTSEEIENSRGMCVFDSDHPIFAATGLKVGEWFGQGDHIVDVEIDGIAISSKGAVLNELKSDAPKTTRVIATSTLIRLLGGKMVVRPATIAEIDQGALGGRILHLGSCAWFRAATSQGSAGKVLRNAINYQMRSRVADNT